MPRDTRTTSQHMREQSNNSSVRAPSVIAVDQKIVENGLTRGRRAGRATIRCANISHRGKRTAVQGEASSEGGTTTTEDLWRPSMLQMAAAGTRGDSLTRSGVHDGRRRRRRRPPPVVADAGIA